MEGGPGRLPLRLARGVLAALDAVAMATIVISPGFDLANFFSYFTIESNVIAIVILAGGAVVDPRGPGWGYLRGAATLYVTITGLVYNTLLLHVPVGIVAPWVNDVVHRAVPALMLLDWVLFSPWARTHLLAALLWLAYPLAYVAYTLIRGPTRVGTRTPSSIPGRRAATGGSRSTPWSWPRCSRCSPPSSMRSGAGG